MLSGCRPAPASASSTLSDPDFGLGGTNLKGVTVRGALALAEGVLSSVRWMSADAIAAWPYGVDLLQIDVSARY